jgi:hypothetical protein
VAWQEPTPPLVTAPPPRSNFDNPDSKVWISGVAVAVVVVMGNGSMVEPAETGLGNVRSAAVAMLRPPWATPPKYPERLINAVWPHTRLWKRNQGMHETNPVDARTEERHTEPGRQLRCTRSEQHKRVSHTFNRVGPEWETYNPLSAPILPPMVKQTKVRSNLWRQNTMSKRACPVQPQHDCGSHLSEKPHPGDWAMPEKPCATHA